MEKLTKKQKLLNKKERYKKSKSYFKKQNKKELKNKDKEWAIAVKNRDDNKCVICGDTKMLNAHHILPRENKKLRWELDNGITLCPKHHRFSFEISAHQNSFDFFCWFMQKKEEQFKRLLEKSLIN